MKKQGLLFLLLFPALSFGVSSDGTLRPADYGKWEQPGFASLSADGGSMAVPITRVDGTAELQIHPLADRGSRTVVPQARGPVFSRDSQWLACQIFPSEAEREKLQKDKKPVRNGLGLVRLSDGSLQKFETIERFAFSHDGGFLAALAYAPERPAGAEAGKEGKGADLILLKLGDGTRLNFGNVAEFAWQEEGPLLALAIRTEDKQANGVQLFDTGTGSLQVLASGKSSFANLSWRKKGDSLAFFESREDAKFEEQTQRVHAWRGLSGERRSTVYDQAQHDNFPAGMRIVAGAGLKWADDGSTLFFGIREWERKPEKVEEKKKEATADGNSTAGEDTPSNARKQEEPKPSDVQIWHSRDERIFPMQELQKDRDRRRGLLCAWHLDDNRLVRLGTDLQEDVTLLEGQKQAVETDGKPYAFDNQFDNRRQDIYLVQVADGSRKKVIEGSWYFSRPGASARYLLHFAGDHYWSYDTQTGRSHNLTAGLKSAFVDEEYDTPVRQQRPPWGNGGWLKGDAAVLLYDRYDVWAVSPDGKQAVNLTDGRKDEVRHRYLHLDEEERAIDPARPLHLSLYGEWTKKEGLARLTWSGRPNQAPAREEHALWLDKRVFGVRKARQAEVVAYAAEGFDDSTDYFAAGAALADGRQVTTTNTFQSEYAWGRSELIEYRSAWGKRLQGALFYPAAYDPSKKYPMIVYIYERRSQVLHQYPVPSQRNAYNTGVFTQEGYFVLQPDIVYRDRDPGVSAVQCVVPAVQKVLEGGKVDPARVGLVGHSWGGYEASYIPTQTDIFAASIAGAPLTNFFSMFGTVHWNQGLPETSHFETGQARMAVPYWEDMEAYVRNSPVMGLTRLKTPMLIFFGDKDGTVDWHQGVEMYNYARRAGKFLVMLVYPGENHSAAKKENQIDYHRRVLRWFGHFLKGEEAPAWIREGVPALERDKALKAGKP